MFHLQHLYRYFLNYRKRVNHGVGNYFLLEFFYICLHMNPYFQLQTAANVAVIIGCSPAVNESSDLEHLFQLFTTKQCIMKSDRKCVSSFLLRPFFSKR
jgi:hypothetical protein